MWDLADFILYPRSNMKLKIFAEEFAALFDLQKRKGMFMFRWQFSIADNINV